ncbi:hypothetical protein ACLBWT_15345 [Paenibacillus sp. D51F]
MLRTLSDTISAIRKGEPYCDYDMAAEPNIDFLEFRQTGLAYYLYAAAETRENAQV